MTWHREFSGRLRWMCVAAFLVCGAVPAYAQAVIDPQRAEFTPSTDHNTVVDGVAVVDGYRLDIYVSGSSTTVERVELGKPSPESDGQIRVNFLSLLSTPLTAGVTYEARIVAHGPGGETASGLTNTFSFSIPCTPALSAGSTSIAAAGGSGSVNVTAGTGCTWTAASNNGWIHVTSGASGSGNGTVGFSVDANTSTSSRTGSLTIAGLSFSVQQSGATPCSYSISPTSIAPGPSGASGNVGVTAGSTCDWTAVSNRSWIRVTSGA
ncbi:MAG TPA: BACON domain-containing protein, partial [Vicinamibacterales bacterium]|nr:BACON domain-containing protein [Vicinamibacterales bacterium]